MHEHDDIKIITLTRDYKKCVICDREEDVV